MSGGLAVFKGHASRLFTIHRRMTQARFGHPTHDPHIMYSMRILGKRSGRRITTVKAGPACPRTVLGLAQQRVALMCGPGPGAPVGVQK